MWSNRCLNNLVFFRVLFLTPVFLFKAYTQPGYSCSVYFEKDSFKLNEENELIIEAFLGKIDSLETVTFAVAIQNDTSRNSKWLNEKRGKQVKNLLSEYGVNSVIISETNINTPDIVRLFSHKRQRRVYHKSDYLKIGKFNIAFDTLYKLSVKIDKQIADKNFITGKDTLLIQQHLKENAQIKESELRQKILSAPVSKKDVILLPNILFEGGKARILKESYKTLELLASVMKEKPTLKIKILGHICCAPKGRDGLNEESGRKNLSSARAKAVYKFLIKSGINKKRLKYKGMKANYKTGRGAHFDRRVEIKILEN